MDKRSQNVKRNIAWGLINSTLTVILPFITRTVIIYTIGIEYTGLNSLFQSILQALSFAELGIGSAMVFSMYKPMADNNTEMICALLKFYRRCYKIIGIIILSLGLALLPFVDLLIAGDIPGDVDVHYLFAIYLIDNVIGYLFFAYKTSLFQASQRVDWISRINILVQIIKCIIQIFAVSLIRNYYIFAIALPLTTLLNNLITEFLSRKNFPEYICAGNLYPSQVLAIGNKIGGMVFQKIGSIILSSADTIVISAFLGLKVLGIYNGYYYVITALTSFLSIIHRSLIPSIGNSIVKESDEKNYRDFNKFHFIYGWIIGWGSICLLCLYQPFIRLWQGSDNILSMPMAALFSLYFFVFHIGDMSHIYREALGLWWEGKFIPLISSIINLTLNLLLVNKIGLYGILIATIISVIFINIPFVAYVVFKYYFHSKRLWLIYLHTLIKRFLIVTLIAIITYLTTVLIPFKGMLQIGIICVFLPNIIFIAIYKKSEDFENSFDFLMGQVPESIRIKVAKFIKFKEV